LQRGTGVEKGGPHNLRFCGERPERPDFILHTVKNLKIFLSRFCTFLEEFKLQSIKIIICLIVSSKNIKNFKNKDATLFLKRGPHTLRFYGERPERPDFILHTVKNLDIFFS